MFNSSGDIKRFIEASVDQFLKNGSVTIATLIDAKHPCKSTIYWDQRELIYRFNGELSKGGCLQHTTQNGMYGNNRCSHEKRCRDSFS